MGHKGPIIKAQVYRDHEVPNPSAIYLSIYTLSNTATCTRHEVWGKHFLCTVPHKILHYIAYADSIQMHPLTSHNLHSWDSNPFPVKQIITQGKRPFTQVFIRYYSRYTCTFSRISYHTTLPELETDSTAIICHK